MTSIRHFAWRRTSNAFSKSLLNLRLLAACVAGTALLLAAGNAEAQVKKGYQILIDRGFQSMGVVRASDPFHLSTYSNANYNAIMWEWTSNPSATGAAPGFPWARWIGSPEAQPPQG